MQWDKIREKWWFLPSFWTSSISFPVSLVLRLLLVFLATSQLLTSQEYRSLTGTVIQKLNKYTPIKPLKETLPSFSLTRVNLSIALNRDDFSWMFCYPCLLTNSMTGAHHWVKAGGKQQNQKPPLLYRTLFKFWLHFQSAWTYLFFIVLI